ncbi:MAG TPA: radical SAM protein, partial [Deltaproteobacteria bacterium]|nr:radical SAM protein [Deltaproteobacteria bacterium]
MWTETGTIRKDPGGRLNVALVYPSTYWVGMSNLGFQQMYRLLNAHPGILCERFFSDHERSVETGRPLSAFHIIAFSVSYELDYIEAVRILARSGIGTSSTERAGSPLVMAGGAAVTMNPEPFAQACDICFLGDGETLPENLHDAFVESPDLGEFLLRME